MTTYYTGKGDDGSTGVIGRGRISKASGVAQAMGDVDELNSVIGVAIAHLDDDHLTDILRVVQDKLFAVGAELSSSGDEKAKRDFGLAEKDVRELEHEIDEIGSRLPELKRFVLPNGSISASHLHLARAVARRAERSVVALMSDPKMRLNPQAQAYLNRLSSLLFTAALYMNKKEGVEESHPTYK